MVTKDAIKYNKTQEESRGQRFPSRWPPGYNTKDGIKYNKTQAESQEDFLADGHQAITPRTVLSIRRHELKPRGQLFPSRWTLGYNTKDCIKYYKTQAESQENNSFLTDDHQAITPRTVLSITRHKRKAKRTTLS